MITLASAGTTFYGEIAAEAGVRAHQLSRRVGSVCQQRRGRVLTRAGLFVVDVELLALVRIALWAARVEVRALGMLARRLEGGR